MSLRPVLDALNAIAQSSSRKVKKSRIEASLNIPFFKEVVVAAYDSRKAYNIKNFPKKASKLLRKTDDEAIFKYLNYLAQKRGATNDEVKKLHLLCADDATCEIVWRILNKDLRCGVNIKTWKEYFDLFEHNPMLCEFAVRYSHRRETYSDDLNLFVTYCGGWENIIGSVKANGVRVWVDNTTGKPEYISRSGKKYENFHILNKDVITIMKYLMSAHGLEEWPVLDGEVVFLGEDFQDQMRQVRRIKDMDPSKFRFVLFDCPTLKGDQAERSEMLNELVESLHENRHISKTTFTEEVMFENFEDFDTYFLDVVNHRKLEGLVLKRADAKYEFKRSKDWCKVKDWFSADLCVIDVEEGTGKYEGVLGALIVDFNGVEVRVGSGYSDEQRIIFWEEPPKVVEIEYKMVTKDGSLQHPTFVKEREDLIGVIKCSKK